MNGKFKVDDLVAYTGTVPNFRKWKIAKVTEYSKSFGIQFLAYDYGDNPENMHYADEDDFRLLTKLEKALT